MLLLLRRQLKDVGEISRIGRGSKMDDRREEVPRKMTGLRERKAFSVCVCVCALVGGGVKPRKPTARDGRTTVLYWFIYISKWKNRMWRYL